MIWRENCTLGAYFLRAGDDLDEHVSTKKIFFEAAGECFLTASEIWHIRMCEECREVRKVFSRLLSYQPKSRPEDQKKIINE
jgi:hypothetical protein